MYSFFVGWGVFWLVLWGTGLAGSLYVNDKESATGCLIGLWLSVAFMIAVAVAGIF